MTALLDPNDRDKVTVHYAAVAAPHASPPTEDAVLQVWRIQRGPKLTRRTTHGADGHHKLLVPSLDTWTGDVARMLVHRLAALVPAKPHWTPEKEFALGGADITTTTARFEIKRNLFKIWAESHDAGVSIVVSPWQLSDPMQAWIMTLPTAPFPVTAIANPGYIDVPSVDEDDLNVAAGGSTAAADVADVYRRLRRLSPVDRQALDELTRLMEKRVDDDEEG